MESFDSSSYPDTENSNNKKYYLCINPNCQSPRRPGNENSCQACGSALLFNERYRVIDVLSKSQHKECKLYNAVDITDGNKSKVLKVLYTHNPEALTRFNRGAEILINYGFSGVPKVDKGGYFHINFPKSLTPAYGLVMEKIEGKNLQEWLEIKNNLPISPQKAIEWLQQLIIILSRLHQQQFYHQDIKPSNIMLRNRPEELILIDLDTVTAITKAAEQALKRIETSGYQAPEQEDGNPVPQSDFYALGRILVHLLTGKHPHNLSLDNSGRLRWRYSAKKVSKNFADLIDNLMEWDYQKRPQNPTEILQNLEEIKRDLERQKKIQQVINFKKAVGLIVILSVTCLGYIAIKSPNRLNISPGNLPSPATTSTSNPKCKIRQDTGAADNSALAWDARQILQDYRVVNSKDREIQEIQDLKVTQFNCDLNIYVTLPNKNILSSSLKNKITDLLKKKFDYVGTIRVIQS